MVESCSLFVDLSFQGATLSALLIGYQAQVGKFLLLNSVELELSPSIG
jgi:hypothetical protein